MGKTNQNLWMISGIHKKHEGYFYISGKNFRIMDDYQPVYSQILQYINRTVTGYQQK